MVGTGVKRVVSGATSDQNLESNFFISDWTSFFVNIGVNASLKDQASDVLSWAP